MTFDLYLLFRELSKLDCNFVATVYDKFERSYSQKKRFWPLTSSDLGLRQGHSKFIYLKSQAKGNATGML